MNDGFEQSLPMLLMRTLAVVMPHFRAIYSAHHITDQQWRVLRVLWQGEACRPGLLAQRTLIAAPALVGVIDRLEKRGLVVRRTVPDNRRAVEISVTDEGLSLYHAVQPQVSDLYQTIMAGLPADKWDDLRRSLDSICAHVKDIETGGGDRWD